MAPVSGIKLYGPFLLIHDIATKPMQGDVTKSLVLLNFELKERNAKYFDEPDNGFFNFPQTQ